MKQQDASHIIAEMFGKTHSQQRSGMVVGDSEIAYLLTVTADLMSQAPCLIEECEACDLLHTIWWGWSNDLTQETRVRMQAIMKHAGVPLPPGPVEVIPRT